MDIRGGRRDPDMDDRRGMGGVPEMDAQGPGDFENGFRVRGEVPEMDSEIGGGGGC